MVTINRLYLQAGKAHCAIEAKPNIDWGKGKVALLLLNKIYGPTWKNNVKVIFAGDDTTDEDAMIMLKGYGATFKVSQTEDIGTAAERRINSTEDVVKILKLIEKNFTH